MSANSIEYFHKLYGVNPNSVFGYFDFGYSGYSGKNQLTGLQSGNSSKLVITDPNNSIWKNSGSLSLDASSYLKYEGLLVNPYAAAISFSRDAEKEYLLFSSMGQTNGVYSGFNVGISAYGYPYVEYIDNVYGRVTLLNTSNRYPKTGILFIEVDSNSCSLGTFTDPDNFNIEKCKFFQNGYAQSNSIYIGGNPNLNNNNNFSGKIFEFILQSKDFLSYDPNLILSGFLYDVQSIKTTGYISGQTGILYGDIISISGCQFFVSDTRTESVVVNVYTGITEYFSNEQEFRDFNNDIYYSFTTSFLTGVVNAGLLESAPERSFSCFSNTDYSSLFQYASGYVINYSITNYYSIPKFEEFFLRYSSGISYNFTNTGDSIFNIYIFNDKSKNNLLNFNQVSNNFITVDSPTNIYGYQSVDLNTGNFDLFNNGQLQRVSTGYNQALISGRINYLPEYDFLKSGLNLFNNNIYDINLNNFIGSEGFASQFYTLTQSYSSGGPIGSISLANSLIFFNGQLLTSGIDYFNNNILFNIDNQNNVLAKIPLSNVSYKNIVFTGNTNIGYVYEGALNIKTDSYLKDSSMVWLNGIRMKLNNDYIELDDSIFSNQFVETNGYLIYNNTV